ncbi:MAG: hypothetical protein SGARI_001872 [Bacillariaceae sp.]
MEDRRHLTQRHEVLLAMSLESEVEVEMHTPEIHMVEDVACREVQNELPVVGTVTVLEATADAQEELVDEVLLLEDERDESTTEARIKEGDPYGSVLWPAAWAVANFLLTTPEIRDTLSSTSVLELGTGTGLVSVTLAMAGTQRVAATDYEPLALKLTEYAANKLGNSEKPLQIETGLFDLCNMDKTLPKEVDMIVAADIMYEPKTGAAMAHRVAEALENGCQRS